MKDRILDTIKGAVEINLRYSAVALNLSKEYIKDFSRVIKDSEPASAATTAPQTMPTVAKRPPILLIGQLNEVATGAFALNNTSETELKVNLVVQGELDARQVELTPASLILTSGGGAFVRLKVKMTEALLENRDYVGAVSAPGLSAQAIEFVVRRLPATERSKPKRNKGVSNRAKG